MQQERYQRRLRRRRIGLIVAAAVLLALVVGTWLYLKDYYHADDRARAALRTQSQAVQVRLTDDRADFIPSEPTAGLIFYPGGKVEFTAYAPLMQACAERGILCVLLRMPANLAVLDEDAADGVAADYPEITRWYVGGHSLGGTIAASYAADHPDAVAGVILLGAYATSDLRAAQLQVLSVYGSEDGVMNRDRYERNRANLPADTAELVIPGGCHSWFGSYGLQSGDGTPAITPEEQVAQTADAIAALASPAAQQDAA